VGASIRPLTEAELVEYLSGARDVYLADRLRAGDDPTTAARRADDSFGRLFRDGRPAPGHAVYAVVADGQKVGTLWIGPQSDGGADRWWVWDIVIDEAFRGRGLGRQAMRLAEDEARAGGASELGLNVFGYNDVAIGLYRSLGYEVTAMQMRKPL
jgi:ribosomal protein S18 acetylase RimI-like enzyme